MRQTVREYIDEVLAPAQVVAAPVVAEAPKRKHSKRACVTCGKKFDTRAVWNHERSHKNDQPSA